MSAVVGTAGEGGEAEPAGGAPASVTAIVLLLLAGILAGTQLGKIAPLVGWYRDALGFSLVTIGWIVSAIGFFVAFLALPAGGLIDRIGARRAYGIASAVLVLGGLAVAITTTPALIVGARLLEGLGYLVLVVAIPAILTTHAPAAVRGPALAIWGGFVPIGFALADFGAAAIVPAWGPQGFLLATTLAFSFLAAAAGLLLTRSEPRPAAAGARLAGSTTVPVLCVAASFGLYVVLSIAFFSFLPAFVQAHDRLLLTPGAVALFVPAGNLVTGALVRGRGPSMANALAIVGFAACALAAVPLYASAEPAVSTLSAIVFAFASGVIASALFAGIPFIVPAGGSAAMTIGLVAQAGGVTTLIAPPLAGHVIETFGWVVFGWALSLVSLLGLAVLLPNLKADGRT